MKQRALVELTIVALVFWSVWSLRFLGVQNVGVWTMLSAGGLAVLIIALQKESWRDYGIRAPRSLGWTLARAGEFAALTFVAGVGVFAILSAIGYAPTQSAVLANQPTTLIPFLLDLIIGGWLAAGVAEEFFFRGFLLAKFRQAFGAGRIGLICAVIAQAVWFGAAHASQGLSGVVAISFLAVVLAVFFLTRANKTLVPLMVGHAFVDTISLTSNYLTQ